MKPVVRAEILGLAAYEQVRARFRARVIEEKRARRVALGPNVTAVFENHDTVLLQIQEMIRTERITAEAAIAHEIETYNFLIPGKDELSLTIFLEYPDPAERERMLVELAGVERCFYVAVDGERVPIRCEARSVRADRTTAVHYGTAVLGPEGARRILAGAPVALGVDHPRYRADRPIEGATLAAVQDDLR